MKLLVLSDLHFEFHRDKGSSFIKGLSREVDACVIAGDLGNSKNIVSSLKALSVYFKEIPVIYVNGNHDFYGSTRENVVNRINNLAAAQPNLHYLDNNSITLDGQRFLGTPLWFRDHPMNQIYQSALSDFRVIKDYTKWVYKENHKAREFIEQNLTKKDVVITHHLPCEQSIPQGFKQSNLNRFFLCDMHDVILNYEPKLWIHGHTHTACDYISGNTTRIVCNPLGYPFENTRYTENFVMEV
jgi:Icc-related predicted phosphoesterase